MPKKDFNATKEATALASKLSVTLTTDGVPALPPTDLLAEALQAAYDAGRNDLNGRDMIDTLDAGAVEFLSDHSGKVWLNVDGRCVFRAGHTESVKVDITRIAGDTVADTVKLYGEQAHVTAVEGSTDGE